MVGAWGRGNPFQDTHMVLIDSGLPFEHLVVERFDYSPVSGEWGDWAVLQLLARLGTEPVAPFAAHLLVQAGSSGDPMYAAAQESALERRLDTTGGVPRLQVAVGGRRLL